jgi:hypothetical protein
MTWIRNSSSKNSNQNPSPVGLVRNTSEPWWITFYTNYHERLIHPIQGAGSLLPKAEETHQKVQGGKMPQAQAQEKMTIQLNQIMNTLTILAIIWLAGNGTLFTALAGIYLWERWHGRSLGSVLRAFSKE